MEVAADRAGMSATASSGSPTILNECTSRGKDSGMSDTRREGDSPHIGDRSVNGISRNKPVSDTRCFASILCQNLSHPLP